MKTRLVKVGNSQGIRIPRAFIEAAGIESEVDMDLEQGAIVLRPPRKARAGWEELFQQLGPDTVIDDDFAATEWDDQEWEWE